MRRVLCHGSTHGETLERLCELVGAGGVRADFSSVYRAVLKLEQDGEVVRVDLGDGVSRFEASGDHHEHVRCDLCGAVAAVPGCLLGSVAEMVMESTGFELSQHSLVLSGTCSGCRGNESATVTAGVGEVAAR